MDFGWGMIVGVRCMECFISEIAELLTCKAGMHDGKHYRLPWPVVERFFNGQWSNDSLMDSAQTSFNDRKMWLELLVIHQTTSKVNIPDAQKLFIERS